MNNALISWDLPTQRVSGAPIFLSEIKNVAVFLSADLGNNFVHVTDVLPTDFQSVFFPDQVPGDYIVRLVVEDVDNKTSTKLDVPYKITNN